MTREEIENAAIDASFKSIELEDKVKAEIDAAFEKAKSIQNGVGINNEIKGDASWSLIDHCSIPISIVDVQGIMVYEREGRIYVQKRELSTNN